MPYATTHILIAIILIELFREYLIKDNRKFPRYYIFIAAIGAIIPDLDIIAFYILSFFGFTFEQIHKTFMHTLFIQIILFLIGIFALKLKIKNHVTGKMHLKLPIIFFILFATSLLHLILDSLFWPNLAIFYPFSSFTIGTNLLRFFPQSLQSLILPTLDGVLILLWIIWMEFKLKINNYF